MPIQAKCPGCGTVYLLVDEQRGLRVLCRNCAETFIVGAEVTAAAAAAPPPMPPTLMPPPAQAAATAAPPVARKTIKAEAALYSLPSKERGRG